MPESNHIQIQAKWSF